MAGKAEVSSRAKRKLETRLRGGAEMALLNDYALHDEARVAPGWQDAHRASVETILARVGTGYFTINTALWDANQWGATEYDHSQPGPVTPIRNAGTKARAVRLRGMVGVLQDSLHQAGVWPWLDGRKCVRKPWELTMEGLMGTIERMSRGGIGTRFPDVRVTAVGPTTLAGRMEMARDLINDGHITPAQYVRILGGEPRKKPRYTPPPTRLDGRRKR